MQGPIFIFDHINKVATVIQPGVQDPRLAALLAQQRDQLATTNGAPRR